MTMYPIYVIQCLTCMIEKTYSSWLIYYLGSKNEDAFVSPAVKLGYPMLTKKMDNILVAILQESNDSKKSQRIVLRYLSFFLVAG